jgi:BirA family biotin operon repressor/biotin-[acetyl-CoA-carboxylase] ligase
MPEFDAADAELRRAGREAFGEGFAVRLVARTASTQDLAAAAARAGEPAGRCVVAEEQTAGRGRLGRRWEAPPGSALLVSILLRPSGPLGWVPIAAGLAVAGAVAATAGADVTLKWPNDVLAAGGKLAGVLAELEPRGAGGAAVILGVGINVRVDAFPAGVPGASLHRLVAPDPPPRRETLLAALVTGLRRRLDLVDAGSTGLDTLRADWEAGAAGLGEAVSVVTPGGGEVRGIALGLDAAGGLRVRREDGEVVSVLAGDVLIG